MRPPQVAAISDKSGGRVPERRDVEPLLHMASQWKGARLTDLRPVCVGEAKRAPFPLRKIYRNLGHEKRA